MLSALAFAAFISTSAAHYVVTSPKPFDASVKDSLGRLDNGPLQEDGSDYPCKMSSGFSFDGATKMNLGSTQELTLMGSAVHGGGSGQISITRDPSPTKSSIFKVLKSYHGGFPARNIAGNFPEDPLFKNPNKYSFDIPQDLQPGRYVMAMTSFNRIGNREMYMNCMPVEIVGNGSGDDSAFDALPDIVVANIGAKKCTTQEESAAVFPNPGKFVETNEGQPFEDLSVQPACAFNWMARDAPEAPRTPSKPDVPQSGNSTDATGEENQQNPGFGGPSADPTTGQPEVPADAPAQQTDLAGPPADPTTGQPEVPADAPVQQPDLGGPSADPAAGGNGEPGNAAGDGSTDGSQTDSSRGPVTESPFVSPPVSLIPSPDADSTPVAQSPNAGSSAAAEGCKIGYIKCQDNSFANCLQNGTWEPLRKLSQCATCENGVHRFLIQGHCSAKFRRSILNRA